ncbi:hypothetical protein [Klebsiella aerogenes]|uniref:hypothetical protein n=1 Tax=Klebsiella aerogenes TaxID=548 RepID=UPI001BCE54EF|nr:hypothetical protein [Klebsiella aerogenes]
MNNEIEQIAQQNDMSVEFVHWFFNEKKAACGEHWFLALGAMWEGWKAREGEVTALALTLEKSREASGCPAGVDLQDWVKRLAAENVGMKASIPPLKMINDVTDSWDDVSLAEEVGFNLAISAIMKNIPDTPATDRILAEAEARGIEKGIAHLENKFSNIGVQIMNLQWLADSLREGDDK